MPEQLTKHPDVTLQVLASAGAQCGQGAPQTILVQCPAARFCKLPGGEICVYGLHDAQAMTQISRADWAELQVSMQSAATVATVPWDFALGGAIVGAAAAAAVAAALVRRGNRRDRGRKPDATSPRPPPP